MTELDTDPDARAGSEAPSAAHGGAAAPPTDRSPVRRRGRGGPGLRWGIAAFLVLLSVVALVVVVLEVTRLRPDAQQDASAGTQQAAATRAAERFTVQVNTYSATSMGSYRTAMNAMMSPKFRTDYKNAIDQLSSTIKQAKVVSKGTVLASAVASIDPDSAEVLVVSDAAVKTTYDPSLARHFRWSVSLVKLDGRWLVDDFTPVS